MKKFTIHVLLILGITGLSYAQIPAEQTIKVNEEQVPISVRVALEKDFGLHSNDGLWMVHMIRTQQGGRTATEAEWYSFNKRASKKEKIEVRYSPVGELLNAKGIARNGNPEASR